nr:MAG TPA: hypothetical protein [Caudoviricetes sp.]
MLFISFSFSIPLTVKLIVRRNAACPLTVIDPAVAIP